jgi:hypothetical protein
MRTCGCTGFAHDYDCSQRPDRPLMTSRPAGTLNPDDLVLADYDLHMGKEFRREFTEDDEDPACIFALFDASPEGLTSPAPEQAAHLSGIFARSRVGDWDALHACRCYAEDRCMMDTGCPFAVHCLAAENEEP